jgi:hypothetical protein
MKNIHVLLLWLAAGCLAAGCGTYRRVGLEPARAREIEQRQVRLDYRLSLELEEKILTLDPLHVSEAEVREVLSQAPAPRMILIHGGLTTVIKRMVSFAKFLEGMGYPAHSLTNPADGRYTFSCLERADLIAGTFAWYFEKEGLRPMMVGHSQGGMQLVKVLYRLGGSNATPVAVWNPLTWKAEDRFTITDPLTGQTRPVVELRVPYASSVGAGGLTRVLPNQWELLDKLRTIPDSVEEFTGFYCGADWFGSDLFGYTAVNQSHPVGATKVRTVQLPASYGHGSTPESKHLVRNPAVVAWLNRYEPADQPFDAPKLKEKFDSNTRHILWAADVWYSIKKHWVLELQNLIRARREGQNAR